MKFLILYHPINGGFPELGVACGTVWSS